MRNWLALILLLPALACAGTPDLRELDLHKTYGVTLRWDNIEQSPAWVAGIKPQKSIREKWHTIHLAPGQWVEVQVSANSLLRIHPIPSDTDQPLLRFDTSSGSDLYVRQQAENLANGDLLLDARNTTPWLARVSLDASASRDVEVALFSSRLVELPAIKPYRYRQAIDRRDERVRYAGDTGAQLFNRLDGGELIELSVEGPARYRLQQRLLLTDEDHGPRNYQLYYQLDDEALQVVDASVSAARRRQLILNGEAVSASNLRHDYIDIPEGQHQLRLQFSENILLRILKSLPDDYLLADLNMPVHDRQTPAVPDTWALTPQQLYASLQPGSPLRAVKQSIMRIITDNRRSGGGLVGPMALMDIAANQSDAPALQVEAQVLLGRHSYYDDLLPVTAHGENRHVRFSVRQLREPQDNNDQYLMTAAERSELANTIESAWFTTLAEVDEMSFNLPDRPADSLLRIVVLDKQPPVELQLFMDDRPPLQLTLIARTATDPARYVVNAAAALAAQAEHTDRASVWQLPVQLTQPAAALEFRLPREVKNIRIQRSDRNPQPLSLALQYRVARPYRLSDASYIQLLKLLRKELVLQTLWQACLTDLDTALDPETRIPDQLLTGQSLSENTRSAARAVVNHWVPLLRWLRARQESYRANIDIGKPPLQRIIPTGELNNILAAAKRAERAEHWLPALEYWSRLSDSTQAQHRQAALSGRVRALLKLGEYPLAERLLRGNYLNDTPATLQKQRFEQVRMLYRQQNNMVALEGLLATTLSRSTNPALLSELAVQLVDTGRLQDALIVGMLIPDKQRPHARLLAAALKQKAWHTFEQLMADIDDDRERSLWMGYRAWALDDPEKAREYWQVAGNTGEALLQKNPEGQQILTALLHGDEPAHMLAAQRLADWLPQLPGPGFWQPATMLARGHAGIAGLYSPALDLGFNALRARPDQPVQLRIAGPVRLRFDIQPLHNNDHDLPLDGWLRIRSDTQEWISPFTGNRASTSLDWPGSPQRPGRIERRELQLPAGIHQLEIQSIDHEVLLRLYVEAPLLDLGLSQTAAMQVTPYNENLPARVSDIKVTQWNYTRPAPLKSLTPIPQDNHPSDQLTSYQDMVAILWQLEKTDADTNALTAKIEAQAKSVQEQPQASFIRPLLKRATRGAEWQAIEYVPESAGLRYVEQAANAPESPALRARAALLGNTCRGSRLLSGHDELVYTLYNLKPATLRLELIPCNLPFEISAPIKVQVTNNGKPETLLSLSKGTDSHSLKIRTGRGEQVIRLKMPEPAVNQFLGVRIHDPSVSAQDNVERIYHLATHDEPLRFDIEGPAWLRVDELRNEHSFSRYIAVAEGWQSIQLHPDEDRDEALYRLYRRNAGAPPPPSRTLQTAGTITPVPGPFDIPISTVEQSTGHDDYPLGKQEDGTSSIGLRLVSRTRVDDEEESRRSRFRENFSELRAEHRYFDETNNRYWRSEILGRVRKDGNPVLGFGQHLYHWPLSRWPSLQTSANLTGFLQRPGDELAGKNGATEWTVNANARALLHIPVTPRTYHEPALTLFGRAMSLNRNNRYSGESLDRDVFSRYKAQHKGGVRLSEYLLHKPWMDTEWYSQLAVTSNEDFNLASPDNLETRAGWRQLIGALDVDAGFRLRHYLSDDDRAGSSTRSDLRLKMSWMRWNMLQRRAELNLFLNHDIDNNESSVYFGLFLHGGNGRGLRDFRNSEVRFSDIRERNMPNNANRVSPP